MNRKFSFKKSHESRTDELEPPQNAKKSFQVFDANENDADFRKAISLQKPPKIALKNVSLNQADLKRPIAAIKPLVLTPTFSQSTEANKENAKQCRVCQNPFENSKTDSRQITDICGHSICFSCLFSGAFCPICNPQPNSSHISSTIVSETTVVKSDSEPEVIFEKHSSKGVVLLSDSDTESLPDILISHVDVLIPDLDSYQKTRWLFTDIKDCSVDFHAKNYLHSKPMLDAFRNSFGLKSFRPQQFEAVNAALLGENCFVLMPTGGGKSLCYQLPACVSTGVTIVVSPLKSLIVDQVEKMTARNIKSAHLLSSEGNECAWVYEDLSRIEPGLKLVYVTPEKLNSSSKLIRVLQSLFERNLLSRLVIDEAHCVSTWGHDFRRDYTQLGSLRNRFFPALPLMLLTATATHRVIHDVLNQMNLCIDSDETQVRNYSPMTQKCQFFIQSFNRENLKYKVEFVTSSSAAVEKIAGLLKCSYRNKCGIVYCISRNECESVSELLSAKGVKSRAYHAGMDDEVRVAVQRLWMAGDECKVVCATVAFGMGVDKPDVRFVIHLGLPKSLEGYYQESGRAGRDGQVALCLLLYTNQDRLKWLRILNQESASKDQQVHKLHVANLNRMSRYCDNIEDCRRAQILEYFGEHFERDACLNSLLGTTCDNCQLVKTNSLLQRDVSAEAILICRCVQQMREDVTLLHLAEVLKGLTNSRIVDKGHNRLEIHGKLSRFKRDEIEKILRRLVFEEFLREELKTIVHAAATVSYIKIGPKAHCLFSAGVRVEMGFVQTVNKKCSNFKKVESSQDESENEADSRKVKMWTGSKKLSEQKAVLKRCQIELKRLIKEVELDKAVEACDSMVKEMLTQMPQTRADLTKITYFTKTIFEKYKGEEFLRIFKHYAPLLVQNESESGNNANSKQSEENEEKWLNSKKHSLDAQHAFTSKKSKFAKISSE